MHSSLFCVTMRKLVSVSHLMCEKIIWMAMSLPMPFHSVLIISVGMFRYTS